MTRKEIADLLEIVIAQYPNTKVNDPAAMVNAWEMVLGDYSAESVYKAARLHMETCKFFPTIADIREKIVRAEMIYKSIEIGEDLLESGITKKIGIPDEFFSKDRIDDKPEDILGIFAD